MKSPNFNSIQYNNTYKCGYRFLLCPTDSQIEFIEKCIGANRKIYNWAIDKQIEHFESYKKGIYERKFYSKFELQKELTKFKKEPGLEWLQDIPNESLRSSIKRVMKAITMYNSGKTHHRFPQHKTKKFKTQSYQVRGDRLYIIDGKLRIEGLPRGDLITIKCPFNISCKNSTIYNPVISKDTFGKYWFSFCIDQPKIYKPITFKDENINVIGIDINVKDRFVCSNGYRSGSPNISHYCRLRSKRHKRYQKDLKRKKQWEITNPEETYVKSKRELKREYRYKKINRKIANVVENFIQEETNKIINMKPTTIVMEHLDNIDILSKHHVAKLTYQASFYRCRQVMENKCNKNSINFILADKSFPSSQLCCKCGSRNKIPYNKNRLYCCPICGNKIDRDLNAAINLQKLGFA